MAAEFEAIGVVGGGQMGSGIAQLGLVHGLRVYLLDSDPQALTRASKSISTSIQRLVSKGKLSEVDKVVHRESKEDAYNQLLSSEMLNMLAPEMACELLTCFEFLTVNFIYGDSVPLILFKVELNTISFPASKAEGSAALQRLHCTSTLDKMNACDLIIEAIIESEEVKKKLFIKLDRIAKASAILASNTSSISITRLASATKRPAQVIGMHFMNPPPIMKLVEIIRGADTSEETFLATKALAERFGKMVICSQDFSGFIVNRILMPMINEAFYALYTGVATKEDIDMGMKLGTNHPMGPLELADFIGLDVCLSIMRVLHAGLGDAKYIPCPLLVQYVDAGRLGRKQGVGVYDYHKLPGPVKPTSRL